MAKYIVKMNTKFVGVRFFIIEAENDNAATNKAREYENKYNHVLNVRKVVKAN